MATNGQDNKSIVAPAEEFGLMESLDYGNWLKLPMPVMRDVGPAVQTLGGLLKKTSKETFIAVEKIATLARVPIGTARKHLDQLDERGWITNSGRQKTKRGAPRRTCTYKITDKTIRAAQEDYGVLPWWTCLNPKSSQRFSWGAKAVLCVVLARLMSLKSAAETQEGYGVGDDLWDAIANLGGNDRFRFSLGQLERETRLSRPTIVAAKADLANRGIIEVSKTDRADGGTDRDQLTPSQEFRILVTPLGDKLVTVQFSTG